VLFFLAVRLRWRELWQGRIRAPDISNNKAGLLFLWRFFALVLLCSARRSSAVPFVKPSRRWSSGSGATGETFFNKLFLLWCGEILLLVFSPSNSHGGSERGGIPVNLAVVEEIGENPSSLSSTTRMASSPLRFSANKAVSTQPPTWTSRRSSTAPHYNVVRPRWLGDGQRLQFFAGREPTSTLLLFLGGIAWRTPTSAGNDTEGQDCLGNLCNRVFYVKWKSFSTNIRFLRASDEKASLQIL
jgi:hypothetical protein